MFIESKGQVHILEIKYILFFYLTFNTAGLVYAIGKHFDIKKDSSVNSKRSMFSNCV